MCYTAMENGVKCNKKLWEPLKFFEKSTNDKYAVIILNQPILFSPKIILPIWKEGINSIIFNNYL